MSFAKAIELLTLAQMAADDPQGVSYEDIRARFACSHRTAQRMVEALAACFQTETEIDAQGRKRIVVRKRGAIDLPLRADLTLEALQLAQRQALAEGRNRHADALLHLQGQSLAGLDQAKARAAESDADAMLQAWGQVIQPGPRSRIAPATLEAVIEALRGPFRLEALYREDHSPRLLEPHGILRGPRSYLVARQPEKGEGLVKFRLDLLRVLRVLPDSFAMAPEFSIQGYAALGFGVWHDEAEHAPVHWRFTPRVAARAAEFVFHPEQSLTWEKDGSLSVRFIASGWTEMAWYLYQWGDQVEVVLPLELRDMVQGHRRSDLDAFP